MCISESIALFLSNFQSLSWKNCLWYQSPLEHGYCEIGNSLRHLSSHLTTADNNNNNNNETKHFDDAHLSLSFFCVSWCVVCVMYFAQLRNVPKSFSFPKSCCCCCLSFVVVVDNGVSVGVCVGGISVWAVGV